MLRWGGMGAAALLVSLSSALGATGETYVYRVDLTRNEVEVSASFPLHTTKDFAFLIGAGAQPIEGLKVRDHRGWRPVAPMEGGTWRVDGLEAGPIEATFRLRPATDCSTLPCRDAAGVVLLGQNLLLSPAGVDPAGETTTRIEFLLPPRWGVVGATGRAEAGLSFPTLRAAARAPIILGELHVRKLPDGAPLAVQSSGWSIGPESVSRMILALQAEQDHLLGPRAGAERPALTRVGVAATGRALRPAATPDLFLLELAPAADRTTLARQLVDRYSGQFRERLTNALKGADDPSVRWWRDGFVAYTSLLASVRTGALSEERFILRLHETWVRLLGRPGAGTPLADSRRAAEDAARADGALLACFLLDLRLRTGSGGQAGLGDLLAATRGEPLDIERLRAHASRLARADLRALFGRGITGPGPLPFAEEVARAGLEFVEVGTGEGFTGLTLEAHEPVVARVFEQGPARAMGLLPGDRLLAIEDQPVGSAIAAQELLAGRRPGTSVTVTVRGSDGLQFTAVLPLWERTRTVLRRAPESPPAATALWVGLTRGDALTFAN